MAGCERSQAWPGCASEAQMTRRGYEQLDFLGIVLIPAPASEGRALCRWRLGKGATPDLVPAWASALKATYRQEMHLVSLHEIARNATALRTHQRPSILGHRCDFFASPISRKHILFRAELFPVCLRDLMRRHLGSVQPNIIII